MDERVNLPATLNAEQFKRNGRVELHSVYFLFVFFKSPFGSAFDRLTCVAMHCDLSFYFMQSETKSFQCSV